MLTIEIPCPACEAPAGRNCRAAGTVTCPDRVHASVATVGINPSLFAGGEPQIPLPANMWQLEEWLAAYEAHNQVRHHATQS